MDTVELLQSDKSRTNCLCTCTSVSLPCVAVLSLGRHCWDTTVLLLHTQHRERVCGARTRRDQDEWAAQPGIPAAFEHSSSSCCWSGVNLFPSACINNPVDGWRLPP